MRTIDIPSAIVDDPPHILFWEADEFIPALTIFVILYLWDMTFLAIVASIAFTKAFARVKGSNMRGLLFHMLWWPGLIRMNSVHDSGLNRRFDD
ncbi:MULTISPECIES: type IV conjugative transfer system protein TraL [Acidovorax]|mgnify:CR=1 FL=1|jgi:conjugal transfer pilus assembly protein TraL|uniref:Type IV conjugative transfer system protein TraL n=1 Tax=Acidovorax facilis TaxID=12917 RepID=A0ABV8DIW1_9BURK|nr:MULTISPECIES: type IV conjugative transfer system protein TraL [Acidovorax]OJV63653.1 MAG: type IV conjugative transfer system protein TraL [Burkholderiales bacterium 64-34]KQB57324.1 hypothetical protein AE621_21345 [Acidovorax sp. SD340]MBO1008183.1 type IV conjugative transfer system protein TraL [Acidovorax sp. SD340]MCO4241701.1 type IV conjugative transfer system protein TraL [Acidovorax facilis]RKR52832.1 conjugal transfer pilus assembly protein TraL [Acidovorax sp. 94]